VSEADGGVELRAEELAEIVRQIRERVRARYPSTAPTAAPAVGLADLMPLLHARDAAQAKVAAIGTVNPRPPGPLNALIQAAKRLIARLMNWHVREQVEFNRGMVAAVNATLQALNEVNRSLAALAGEVHGQTEALGARIGAFEEEARQLRDIRSHWSEWRIGWEKKLAETEIRHLRAVAELQAAFDQRVRDAEAGFGFRLAQAESAFRELAGRQHADFSRALAEAQQQIRLDFERQIHSELRTLRQRLALGGRPAAPARAESPPADRLDWLRFAERFRGGEEHVKAAQRRYVTDFRGSRRVLDLGCGRGEFLELMAEAGIPAVGVDLSPECVALVRAKGLEAEQADLFEYLDGLVDGSVDGIFCAHLIEHLAPERLPRLIELVARKLAHNGLLVIETPNPACLAIFATHFYADPTHVRPVPIPLLVFYLEEAGFGGIEVRRLAPAVETEPALAELPAAFRDAFFDGLDYTVLARRL